MIDKYGKVTITEDEVLVTEFVFNGFKANLQSASIAALEWALDRITDELILAHELSKGEEK